MGRAFDHHSGQTVAVDGAELYVETLGDSSLPPVLLLHGGLGSIDDFELLAPLVSSRCWLIGLDSRGHGRSTLGEGPLGYERLERDIVRVLDVLGIERPSVVGFSDGGIVGYRLAARHGRRVRALITIGADWDLPDDSPVRTMLSGVTPESWRARFPDAEPTYVSLNPAPDFDRLVAASVEMWLDRDGYPGDDIDSISCPLAIVRGADDPLTSHDLAVELRARATLAELYEIPDAGHAVATTRPDTLAAIIRRALGT